jgi:stearoyl-CoA desaturase (delta-9 desaturase)
MWQHKHYVLIAIGTAFALPAAIGWIAGGPVAALGAFLIAGVARVVVVHHMTFCINSLCHWIGDRPYSSDCTARDSVLMAVCTFGEGYHNFHHIFQHDYRNGVKPWQFDPTKWTIWMLSKVGLARGLRTVPEEKILKAQIAEHERRLQAHIEQHPLTDTLHAMLESTRTRMNVALERWETLLLQYREAAERRGEISRREMRALKRDVREAAGHLRESLRHWVEARQSLPATGA